MRLAVDFTHCTWAKSFEKQNFEVFLYVQNTLSIARCLNDFALVTLHAKTLKCIVTNVRSCPDIKSMNSKVNHFQITSD